MAEHKVQGGDMLLFIDPNGGTNYDVVVCLTSVGKSDSVTVVDASSACGPDKSPGTLEISYSFEGQHLQDPDTGKISGTDLRQLLRSETTIGWKIAPENPVNGDEIEEGTGYLSELSSTYAFDSVGTFTGTLQPYGDPTLTIYGGGGLVVGQDYQGGVIAWLDGGGTSGIIVQKNYDVFGILKPRYNDPWSSPDNNDTGATLTTWGSGTANTNSIIAATTTSLALSIYNDTYDAYSDWVMPTQGDMDYILSNGVVLNIGNGTYATSTQNDNSSYRGFSYFYGDPAGTLSSISKSITVDAFGVRYF